MVSKCCCCVPLRTGGIIIGVLGVLTGIGLLLGGYPNSYFITDGTVQILTYGVLLFGAIQNNKTALLIHLVAAALSIALGISFGIYFFILVAVFVSQFDTSEYSSLGYGLLASGATSFIIEGLLSVYFWICNYSFYKELKKGDSNEEESANLVK